MTTATVEGKNRLSIIEWRELGDYEDSLTYRFLAAGEDADPIAEIREDYELPEAPEDTHIAEDQLVVNVNDYLVDGEIRVEYRTGRKFRIRIEEVTE